MSLEQLTSADAVRAAVAEFDDLGRNAFLERYGFGPSRTYFLKVGDRLYDSKAIVGAAHGHQNPELGPLHADQFSGGIVTVAAKLGSLGFEVVTEVQSDPALHLVVKWAARLGADSVERAAAVVGAHGAAWWGLYSSEPGPLVAASWTDRLRQQLADGVDTFVFLSGPTCHRARMLGVEYDSSAIERELIPDDHRDELSAYHLWVKLADIEPIEKDWLMANLEPVRKPGTLISLGNQTSPLYVRVRSQPRYWWVNQGSSYRRAHDGGYIWAPERDRRGAELPHWRAMRYLRAGDVVLNYANTMIRAVSRVSAAAEPHRRPDKEADQTWSEDGYLARLEYRDIDPISLTEIPEEWRLKERGPFTSDGRVQQGYLYPVSDQFMSQLSNQFPQLDLDMVPPEDSSSTGREASVFDLESIKSAAAERGLMLDDPVYAAVLAALNAGKHVILTGPPGTAKTTLAETIARVAVQSELAAGYVLTTATADWTTYDTIGGLRPDREHGLAFAPGHFIEAIEADDWLIIDELNRSNFDRAFGQLFTVLSGQAVTLPHERQAGSGRLVIAPGDYPNLPGDVIRVPSSWRVIATMNVFDKSLLFEMSFALMRRFAFIEVPSPSLTTFHTLIDNAASGDGDAANIAKHLLVVRQFKDLGPAVFIDLARYLRERRQIGAAPNSTAAFEAFYGYLLPQFEGIDQPSGERLFAAVKPLVGNHAARLRTTLIDVLGLDLPAAATPPAEDDWTVDADLPLDPDE